MALLLASCADGRFILAVQDEAKADLVDQALAVQPVITLPNLPADCRKREHSGVTEGMRLDEALLRTDSGLAGANARVGRCANWYDGTKHAYDTLPPIAEAKPVMKPMDLLVAPRRDQPR